jgi:hypothetical protein
MKAPSPRCRAGFASLATQLLLLLAAACSLLKSASAMNPAASKPVAVSVSPLSLANKTAAVQASSARAYAAALSTLNAVVDAYSTKLATEKYALETAKINHDAKAGLRVLATGMAADAAVAKACAQAVVGAALSNALGQKCPNGSYPLTDKTLTWHWSFLRGAGGSGSEAVRAFGELTTTDSPDTNGFFTIISIRGERNNVAIISLVPTGSTTPGNCEDATTCYEVDNLLHLSGDGSAHLTGSGFGVGLADGTYANYFFANFWTPPAYAEFYSVPPFGYLNNQPPVPPDTELPGIFLATPVSQVSP